MIGTVLRIHWLNLKRDRVALLLTFVLPVVFFSIFAGVFGNQGGSTTSPIRVAVVDADGSEASRRVVEALRADAGLRVRTDTRDDPPRPLDRDGALALVRDGSVPAAVVLPPGFGESFGSMFGGGGATIEILADTADPVAPPMLTGLLQKAAFASAPDLLARGGLEQFEATGGAFSPRQREAADSLFELLSSQAAADAETPGGATGGGPIDVDVVDVLGQTKKRNTGLIAFYAAGTGVMFLLFSMAGAGGALLDEQERGTLERLLISNVGMGRLLLAKWLAIAITGVLQLTVMFAWGALAFGLELWSHLGGFAVMAVVTAAAAAGFGLVLATASRTRAQLSGISTILILVMSALGGSMFPRFLMPETMQNVGLLTFNAWALDGFQKVFWYEQPLTSLWPQVAVLGGLTVAFLALARRLAHRWERV